MGDYAVGLEAVQAIRAHLIPRYLAWGALLIWYTGSASRSPSQTGTHRHECRPYVGSLPDNVARPSAP